MRRILLTLLLLAHHVGLAQGRSTPEEIRVFLLQNEFETVSYGKVRYNATGALDAANLDFYTVRNGEMIVEH